MHKAPHGQGSKQPLSLEPASFWQLSQEPLSNRQRPSTGAQGAVARPHMSVIPPAPWLMGFLQANPEDHNMYRKSARCFQWPQEHPATKPSSSVPKVGCSGQTGGRSSSSHPCSRCPSSIRIWTPRSLHATENFSLPVFGFGFVTPPVLF